MHCAAFRVDAVPKRYPSVTGGCAQYLHLIPAGRALVTKALTLLLATDAISMQHLSEGERMILVELVRKVARVRGLHRTGVAAKPAL